MERETKYKIVISIIAVALAYLVVVIIVMGLSNPSPCTFTFDNGTNVTLASKWDMQTSGVAFGYAILPFHWNNETNYLNKQCKMLVQFNINALSGNVIP